MVLNCTLTLALMSIIAITTITNCIIVITKHHDTSQKPTPLSFICQPTTLTEHTGWGYHPYDH